MSQRNTSLSLFSLASTIESLLLLLLILVSGTTPRVANGAGGQWTLLQENIGIVAMHMQLLHNDRVVIFDRTDFGQSNLSLPDGKCREDPNEEALTVDCTAHSVEYNVLANTFRPLTVQTDVWCSSGSVLPDGRLVQTGGFNDGDHKVRIFAPCDNGGSTCDWVEVGNELKNRRWYATNQKLPDDRVIIVGGRRQFNYEFYPKGAPNPDAYNLPFLIQTNDRGAENNLYPFVFLNVDGHLFMFANTKAILFDYKLSKVVRTYPDIPGGDPRCYPSTGSAVLLPIRDLPGNRSSNVSAEVLVCGGAPKGSFQQASKGVFVKAVDTCGRIRIADPTAQWAMETMPMPRVMNDMMLLPNGQVLIINGGGSGTAGWELGRDPVLNPLIYHPDNQAGSRFEMANPSSIPRMYHSTAVLVRDGRVIVGGSNVHVGYNFSGVLFPTELRLEAYHPPYLDSLFDSLRPNIITSPSGTVGYGQVLVIRFKVTGTLATSSVSVTMVSPSFTTHSLSMNQRLIVLVTQNVTSSGSSSSLYDVRVRTPGSSNLAPAGYYMVFVVHQEIPSQGMWVQIK